MVENKSLALSNVVIARKWSYLEWNAYHKRLTIPGFIQNQKNLGINTEAMEESHFKQQYSLSKILALFEKPPEVLSGENLTKNLLRLASVVISLGGDDHLKYVSHFIDNQAVLAVNSDYKRSEGGMIDFVPEDMENFIPSLQSGDYTVEEWPRLQAIILRPKQKQFRIRQLAMSEIFVGAWARISMSKYELDGRRKDSGALIALPAGIGGGSWFNSAGGNSSEDFRGRPRTERMAWYLSTEVWGGRTLQDAKKLGKFFPGERIILSYTSYYPGVVSIDPKEGSGRNYKISMGDKVVIEFSDQPIRMINRKY